MTDYYRILGIKPEASLKDVKSAFRKKAKQHHPDVAGSGTPAVTINSEFNLCSIEKSVGNNERAMRLLLEAYRVLVDPEKRRHYDRTRRKNLFQESQSFNYRNFLKDRIRDPDSQAKLIVYDLLHDLEDEALEMYEKAKSLGDFRLERFLERGEAMDAEFCIAEEYEKREKWLKAWAIYRKLVRMELEKPWFRYYFDVVVLHYRNVLLVKLPSIIDEEDLLDRLDEAVLMEIDEHDRAQIYRKMAEIYLKRGSTKDAIYCIHRASVLYPRLTGLVALRRKAGISL